MVVELRESRWYQLEVAPVSKYKTGQLVDD
jgi:hypothetical protein